MSKIVFDLGELKLPPSFITSGTTILGQPESGKTNASRRIGEQALIHRVPVTIVDRKGDFWGLRLKPDGAPTGWDIAIFGGEHGDLELTEDSGRAVADAIVENHASAILDLSNFESGAGAARFLTAWSKRLLFLKKDDPYPMLVILDEADTYAPKVIRPGEAPMVGAVLNLRKLGRKRGIGVVANAQRSARLHQDLIDMADLLIMTQSAGRRDQETLRATLKDQLAPAELSELLRAVSRLQKGEAFAYSPSKFDVIRVVKMAKAESFDSSATPEFGKDYAPVKLGRIDIAALRETISKDGANLDKADVDELKATIEKLRGHRCPEPRAAAPERVEVSILTDADRVHLSRIEDSIRDLGSTLAEKFGVVRVAIDSRLPRAAGRTSERRVDLPAQAQTAAGTVLPHEQRNGERRVVVNGAAGFRAGAIRMLEACAQFEERGLTRAQIGALSGIRKGPTFSTYFAELRRAGYLDERSGRVFATLEGIAFLPSIPARPRTPEEIISRWRGEFRAGGVRMLDIIVAAYPRIATRAEIAEGSGILPGPTFSTYLSELKRAELVDERDGGLYAVVLDLVAT